MAVRSFLLVDIESSVGNFFTAGHDGSLLRSWTLALGKVNDVFAHEAVRLSWNRHLDILLVLIDLLILLLKRLFKLHILVIHLGLMHLLLFSSKNRMLGGSDDLIWTSLHGIGIRSRIGGPTSLELLTHFLRVDISHVIRKALCFNAVHRRVMLTMDVRIWHTLVLSILVRIAQALNVFSPI